MIGQRMNTTKALRFVVLKRVMCFTPISAACDWKWLRVRGFARLKQAEAYINKRPDENLYIQDMREARP
jgi:hypothetical protein